jgi:hypothetical protein
VIAASPTVLVLAENVVAASGVGGAGGNAALGLWRGGRPFIDPMNVHELWWWTLVPLAFFVAVAYKAVRVAPTLRPMPWRPYVRGVVMMTVQVVVGMMLLAVALHVLIEMAAPLLD